jgi:hypothetical protein
MPKELIILIALFAIVGVVQFIAGRIYERNKDKTDLPGPVLTSTGMARYDELPAGIAVAESWLEPVDTPELHHKRQVVVRTQMPLLARSLDRLVETDSSKGVK